MTEPITLLWHRADLRLADHPALIYAAGRGRVVPVYILEEVSTDRWVQGSASSWWLGQALSALSGSYAHKGLSLVLRRGKAASLLPEIARSIGATQIVWTERYEPAQVALTKEVIAALEKAGLEAIGFDGNLLFDPQALRTKSGGPFKVYTPFSRACFAAPPPSAPLPIPRKIKAGPAIESANLEDWGLVPQAPDWPKSLAEVWSAGEKPAQARLGAFIDKHLADYATARDRPDRDGTSRLSPYLANGQISARQVWYAVTTRMEADPLTQAGAVCYLKELLWREFSYYLLVHAPNMPDTPLQPRFAAFPWRQDPKALAAWQKGLTGYPIVDAGMRQLWQTGWMHNRVRMIVASFLVKDLLLPWQKGEAWFWDTLIDADLASNAASWQWVSGCGADAAPYFRVFNPVTQGQKFDPNGDYVRHYVPELSGLAGGSIHAPWQLSEDILIKNGVILGKTYPKPLVDHAAARLRALAALSGKAVD